MPVQNSQTDGMTGALFRNILAVIAVALFYSNLHEYLHRAYEVVVPWQWVLAFLIVSLPLLVRQLMTSEILRLPIVVWCFGYLWVTIVWFLLGSQSDMAWQEVRWRILAIFEILGFLAVFMDGRAHLYARLALVVAVHIAVMINVFELFAPNTFSNVSGRSAGLYVNANMSAEALVLGMILGITAVPSWYRGAFIFLTGVGVFVTYSRAGLIGWLIAIGGLMLGRFIVARHLVRIGLATVFLLSLVLLPKADQILTALERAGTLNADTQERLAWFMDPLGVDDKSGWSRRSVAREAWERVTEHPFFGGGTGSVHKGLDIPPHNQFLSHMIDHGMFGAVLMPLLLLALIWGNEGASRRVALIFCGATLWFSFFTHTFLNNAHSLLLIAMVAAPVSLHVRQKDQATPSGLIRNSGRGNLMKTWAPSLR